MGELMFGLKTAFLLFRLNVSRVYSARNDLLSKLGREFSMRIQPKMICYISRAENSP